MKNYKNAWVALVDSRHGRLLRCDLTRRGRCHVEEWDTIDNAWTGTQRQLTSPVRKRAGVTHGMQEPDESEQTHRFARQVAHWLDRIRSDHAIERLLVLAPSHFLGTLRGLQPPRQAEHVRLQKGELMQMPIANLADHPAIREFVGTYVSHRS